MPLDAHRAKRVAIDRYAHVVGGCRIHDDPCAAIDAEHRARAAEKLFTADWRR